ncbi:anhydro-N-acetylmuramic acid kinase [Bradyrhizobium lablabi]|uniref:Anhydro-N-acetylmuramic acid kinase n=1 Tax=Bradyrhizobium lablabi TaxID=722472 RepID=A0A1M6Y2B9_9BRAD|nr:anhydro-N-acetylmuramic acid kinase [Bradyrhizobium lablabi]SHL12318.1 anhydro-N-acetylmuramic acid kinase [Bradyrhizobium lablabi]
MSMERLLASIAKSNRRLIGLMSGMSMDGVDLAFVQITGVFPELVVELIATHYRPYNESTKAVLFSAREGTVRDVCQVNFLVAEEFANCVNDFLSSRQLSANDIDAIGSHGQSIYHVPPGGDGVPSTLQVGFPSLIAEKTGIPTVGNFRVRDMAQGGQGAPLIPLVDYILYRQSDRTIALNNLGSISNVTVVTPMLENVVAFDTGPANMPIDFFAQLIPGNNSKIDLDGNWSARGRIVQPLLEEMMAIPFISKVPPKAAGYDEFGPRVLRGFHDKYKQESPLDLLRTGVEFSAQSIANAYKQFVLPKYEIDYITFTGGGCYNKTLMNRIRELLFPLDIRELSKQDKEINDSKEAVGFAVLANETLSGRPGNVTTATGARKAVVLGELAP